MDKMLIVWRPHSEAHGVWTEHARMGEVGGITLGFYGACFHPAGDRVLGHTFQGAFHHWALTEGGPGGHWSPRPIVSGHFAPVHDVVWDVSGTCLYSVSDDQVLVPGFRVIFVIIFNFIVELIYNNKYGEQTTRLFGPWVHGDGQAETWHEMARPQAHGYDMRCLAGTVPFSFVSGADEKVLRVFEAPARFYQTFGYLRGKPLPGAAAVLAHVRENEISLPSLGLSNKAQASKPSRRVAGDDENEDDGPNGGEDASRAAARPLSETPSHPPLEEDLLQNTLWPETQKLYGHGFELLAITANHAGTLVVSACKVQKNPL
jgi:elongator complex protein 2